LAQTRRDADRDEHEIEGRARVMPVDRVAQLESGREAYARWAWRDAFEALSRAERLAPEDLERLATSAYMLGRDDEYVSALERAHRAHLAHGEPLRAARCAVWIGIILMLLGQTGRASGWVGRARRLVERAGGDCVERGYLLFPLMFEHEARGDRDAAIAAAAEAAAIGERFGDTDLFALAAQDQGLLLVKGGRCAEGLPLLDEAMLAVTAGELSPMVSGFVYCGVIQGCRAAYEPRRAQEWTAALTRWCERQQGLISFTGTCMVHRAEVMQLHGAWQKALEEAREARERCDRAANERAAAEALCRQGELHRLRGELEAAEAAYAGARRSGHEPQPGLALLRLAQGSVDTAAAAIHRLLGEVSETSERVALLPACVEIMLAAGEMEAARAAAWELHELAERFPGSMVEAMAGDARGAVELAAGDARAALIALRGACHAWHELDAPYEIARARVLIALACAHLEDDETAASELDAAREVFARLGAASDLARVESLGRRGGATETHGLTAREMQVLRLVAAGRSNRQVAAALVISEHTVARHVQNIFAKLGVSSRTAAGAFAFTHDLV
jgi:DNA-binding CsgD family transcriptional regulator